jgi:hypothetical protein
MPHVVINCLERWSLPTSLHLLHSAVLPLKGVLPPGNWTEQKKTVIIR